MIQNGQARIARGALVATIVFAAGIFAPVQLFGIDGMKGGYALGFLSFFFTIAAAVTWRVYTRRAKLLDTFLKSKDILARWEVPATVWAGFVAQDLAEEKTDKKRLFFMVAACIVVIGGLFLVFDPEPGRWVAGVLLGVLAIIAPLAFWYPSRRAGRLLRNRTPVIIGKAGAYVGGELHDWSLTGSFLTDVALDASTSPKLLRIGYAYLTGKGARVPVEVRIPVPAGREPEAEHVARALMALSNPS